MLNEKRPIVESFRIVGLHGFKDVEVTFEGPARIVIAENGMGKTTILSALYSFLVCDFERLRALPFVRIECKFADKQKFILEKKDLSVSDRPYDEALGELARFSSHDYSIVWQAVKSFDLGRLHALHTDPIMQEIYLQSPYTPEELGERIADLKTQIDEAMSDHLKALAVNIQSCVGRTQVLYLPTYRRIELAWKPDTREGGLGLGGLPRSRASSQHSRVQALGIRFGLADVEDRIASLTSDIQRRSNQGYRAFSANIIDELLTPRKDAPTSFSLPEVSALARFFSRVEQNSAFAKRRIETLTRLYETKEIDSEDNAWLRYFLSQLGNVVSRTTELEANIEHFVDHVNSYLTDSSDEKRLRYDPVRMKVLVHNTWTESDVKMDDLSSGEKQVVSIFAHLYLHSNNKIVLIDEPELSLSLEWQKRLLPDVMAAPTCQQLLAITHSPFIFENDLDPFAGPLVIERHRK